MNVLSELVEILDSMKIPVETGVFSGTPPDVYAVITPLADTFDQFADNKPGFDIQEIRISYFAKSNYLLPKTQLVKNLLAAGFDITDRRYLSYDDVTKYHQLAIDVAKHYKFEED